MKDAFKSKLLPMAALAAGLSGYSLRWALYAAAMDEKNLLPMLHPLEMGLWAVIAAAVVWLLLQVRKLDGSDRYADNFAPSFLAAAGSLAMAAGILFTVLTLKISFIGPVGKLWKAVGFLSAPALAVAALFRLKGKQTPFLCHFVVCVFFVLHLVNRYQSWSSNPQLQDYFFCLGGSVLMTLFAFYQTAFDADSGNCRMQLAVGLMGGIFCLTALAHSQTPVLYLTGGLWMLTGLCTLTPAPQAPEEKRQESEEDYGAS